MRKLSSLLLALALVFAGGNLLAQDATKSVKAGTKALAKYNSNTSDMASLQEARTAAESATQTDAALSSAWLLLGDTYAAEVSATSNTITKKNVEFELAKNTDPNTAAPDFSATSVPEEATEKAMAAYQKAYDTAEKSAEKKKAKDAMVNLSSALSSIGNAMLSSQRYADSYGPLKGMSAIDAYFREKGETPLFADDKALNGQKYITAVVAQQAGDTENAMKLYRELYEAKHDEPAVYAGYSNMLISGGEADKGLEVLEAGRSKYPENTEILFAEINYYIKKQDFTTLETKLQQAIAAEPDNAGLYTALGNVYMNLGQKEKDAAASKGYYDKSLKYFKDALKQDPKNVDATYSIGSIYYNQAVGKSTEMTALGTSKADLARYDALEAEIKSLFDEALPFFLASEKLDANDRNTLIALKEIYARQNNFEMSNKYKARLEASGM